MLTQYDAYPYPQLGAGKNKMGTCFESSAEESTWAKAPVSEKPVHKYPSLSTWQKVEHHDNDDDDKEDEEEEITGKGSTTFLSEDVFDGVEEKKKGEEKAEEKKDYKVTLIDHPDIADLAAAKDAVVCMGLPELLVRMVIEMEHLDPSLRFHNSGELYQLTEALLSDLQRQGELLGKYHQYQYHQQQEESRGSSSTGGAEPERVEVDVEVGTSSPSTAEEEDDGQNLLTGMSETSPGQSAAVSFASTSTIISSSPSSTTVPSTIPSTTIPSTIPATASGHLRLEMGGGAPEVVSSSSGNAEPCSKGCGGGGASLRDEEDLPESSEPCPSPSPPSSSSSSPSSTHCSILAEEHAEANNKGAKSRKEVLRGRVRSLARENRRLVRRKTCRECRKVDLSDSGVTFLPCGHFVTCEACAEKCDHCPACGVEVMGTVRTYLS